MEKKILDKLIAVATKSNDKNVIYKVSIVVFHRTFCVVCISPNTNSCIVYELIITYSLFLLTRHSNK